MYSWRYKEEQAKDRRGLVVPTLIRALVFIVVITTLIWLALSTAIAQTYYLGVLAPQGEATAQQRWQPWLDTLNDKLKDDTIVLVPLALENWQEQIDARQFALVLGPQVQFIKMDTAGWRWLATLQSNTQPFETAVIKPQRFEAADKYDLFEQLKTDEEKTGSVVNEPNAMEQIASALWVDVNSNIYNLHDLQQRKIVAVDPDAFGGYLLIAHLLQENGIPPSSYQTQFVGFPVERTLSTLASGAVDAAITPLCLMEEMARQGKIDKSQYRIINPVVANSSCQSSTKIYPNWTLAATGQAPTALIEQINQTLFTGQEQTAINSTETVALRWLPPESSVDAERILYDMSRHPSQKQLSTHIIEWINTHRWWMSVVSLIILISTINYGWMSWLAWRRRQQILNQNRLIRDYDHRLRQSERFAVVGEMSGAIAHEINQPLATIQNYAQGLLIRSQNTRFDNISLADQSTLERAATDKVAIEKSMTEKKVVEDALQQIVNETERVATVITNIRRWAGRTQSDEINVDIADTYQQCMALMGEKTAGIKFWYASDYQQLRLPSLLLDQLLINPMLNAQQQGAKLIMLRCQMTEYEGVSWLVLTITDDAGGFDKAHLTANKSSDQTTNQQQYGVSSTKADGLGLGLMICQRLCKSVGGMMQLSNVQVSDEFVAVRAVDDNYQWRLKRSLNNKAQLSEVNNASLFACETGAQVALYLPLQVAEGNNSTDEKIKGSL